MSLTCTTVLLVSTACACGFHPYIDDMIIVVPAPCMSWLGTRATGASCLCCEMCLPCQTSAARLQYQPPPPLHALQQT